MWPIRVGRAWAATPSDWTARNDYVDLTAHVSNFPLGDSARSITGWFNADSANTQQASFFAYGTNDRGRRISITADRTEASVVGSR